MEPSRLKFRQALPDCVLGQASDSVYIELLHQVFTMSMDRLGAQTEIEGYFFDRHLFDKKLQHFPFPVR